MKKIIKAIIMHLPVISGLYRRYCSVQERLHKQEKNIKKLLGENKKQSADIEKLLTKIEEKDREIQKLSKEVAESQNKLSQKTSDTEKRLSQEISDAEKRMSQETAVAENRLKEQLLTQHKEQAEASSRQIESVKAEFEAFRKDTDKKFLGEKERTDKLNNQFSREIFRTNTYLKNMDKDLKARISYKYIQGLHRDNYKKALTEWLLESVGEVGDLDNPRTFNEKIQWIKLNADNELYTRLADKYLVRDWVAEKIGEKYLIPLIGAWDNFDDINFDEFPDKFVLKANHGCKYNYIVYDKNEFNREDARKNFTKWMRENFAWNSLELQYKNIPKKIIAEEYIENSDKNLNDYKIYCFDGKPLFVAFYTERKDDLKMAMFDTDWNLMPFTTGIPQYTGEVERPAQLEEMIRLAGVLAEGFPHVRVDFYVLNDGSIKFGEMTFTTASGFCRWQPAEYNRILGDMITLPIENQ